VENIKVYFGTGMTIGTVPPRGSHTCIRNVTFRNISFIDPFKAVYIKTNPNHGQQLVESGIIENILYDGIEVARPLWWGIYIGPQQQKQPDGGGPGCMLYPLIEECATEPKVTIRNITLRNVNIHGGVFPPGIIRCNSTNPCTDFTFENVRVSNWYLHPEINFITENVQGVAINSLPDPGFNGSPVDLSNLATVKDEIIQRINKGFEVDF